MFSNEGERTRGATLLLLAAARSNNIAQQHFVLCTTRRPAIIRPAIKNHDTFRSYIYASVYLSGKAGEDFVMEEEGGAVGI